MEFLNQCVLFKTFDGADMSAYVAAPTLKDDIPQSLSFMKRGD
jgi:hypothetical protein